jgi:hypothetical protein
MFVRQFILSKKHWINYLRTNPRINLWLPWGFYGGIAQVKYGTQNYLIFACVNQEDIYFLIL